jgi:tetratricopeptide (TPR) repeat protein
VRRAGDRIRIAAQLIDATKSEHVWAETYDREVADVFAVQDEISATIAGSLMGDLYRVEAERAQQRGTENLQAWSAYQLGMQRLDRLTLEDSAAAQHLFERAIARDSGFATAFAQLSMAIFWQVSFGGGDAAERRVSALGAARRAVELDPRDAAAHTALGAVQLQAGDVQSGLASTRRAVELNPSLPDAWMWFGWAQLMAGNPEACVDAAKRSQRLNPQGAAAFLADDGLAWAYWQTGRYREGLEAAQRLTAARPGYMFGPILVALNEVELGRLEEARAAIAEARRAHPGVSLALLQHTIGVSRPTLDARRDAALRRAGLE